MVVTLLVALLLIFGAARRSRHFLWPYIVVGIAKIVFIFIALLSLDMRDFNGETSEHDTSKVAMVKLATVIIMFIIVLIIQIGFTLVAYTYVSELFEELES